ncbi:MAG: glycosyltransferase [Patescibacteria group bacterium]|nr:glycosyltransferase [Patescibacteria group bacterium]
MKISLIIPCYNEEANIQKGVLDKIGNFTKNDSRFLEVIIVDDGSTDKSRKIIKEKYLSLFPKFSLIVNSHQGKAFAVISGIKNAKGDYVMFSDIDLATPIEEADKLIKETEKNYQIIIGSRKGKREGAPLTRRLMAKGFIIIRDILIGLKGIKDTQCGFKLFEKSSALNIIKNLKVFSQAKKIKSSSVSAGFDLEFLFLAFKLGYKIKEIPVLWRHVETKNVAFLKDSIETLKDILKIKFYSITGKYKLTKN